VLLVSAKDGTPTATRRYVSPRRTAAAAETRTAVLDAARQLFAVRGWAGTGMRDVAREAGVAVETVYANFKSKPELLRAAFEAAIVGDALPIAIADRPEFAALGEGDLPTRARAAARFVRAIHERTRGLESALREGAAGDEMLAAFLAEGDARRRRDVETGTRLVAGRDVGETDYDGLWALLSMEFFHLLVDRRGWTADQYEDWLTDALVRLLGPVVENDEEGS
jgi:AcrR family transcriptional regulator